MEEHKKQNSGGRQNDNKSVKGYQIVVIILVVILAVVSGVYFHQSRQLKKEYQIEKDTLTMRIVNLRTDLDNLYVENDVINGNLDVERHKADSLMEKLQSERTLNSATVRKYEKELGTMRTIMRRYVHQIDSLNQLSRALAEENVSIRREATSERLRADAAEERATELNRKVQLGQVVKARNVRISTFADGRPKATPSVSKASGLRINFTLVANELAIPGQRNVYARIKSPAGYVIAADTESLFDFEGDKITYSVVREIDYQNEDLSLDMFYRGSELAVDGKGTYRVELYMDGAKIGEGEAILK